jgi:transposase
MDGMDRKNKKINWREYNEKLVKRGELYLDLNFLRSWEKELKKLNKGKNGKRKRGRQYEFPFSFIKFLGFVHILFHLPYRQLEGFLRKLSEMVELKVPDYTTIFKRVVKMKIPISKTIMSSSEPIVIAIDSSGMKVTNRGEWIREIWKRRKGWIKIHLAVNIKTKEIVSLEVTDERVTDNKTFPSLINKAEKTGKIEKVLADSAYDDRANFNLLKAKGIESGIKIKRSAIEKSRGSYYRADCVEEFIDLGYKRWAEKHMYGYRWMAETTFSSVKRIMGECVRATKIPNMFQEVALKFTFYNMLLNMRL